MTVGCRWHQTYTGHQIRQWLAPVYQVRVSTAGHRGVWRSQAQGGKVYVGSELPTRTVQTGAQTSNTTQGQTRPAHPNAIHRASRRRSQQPNRMPNCHGSAAIAEAMPSDVGMKA